MGAPKLFEYFCIARETPVQLLLSGWVTEIGKRRALLENVEIRLAAMSTFGAKSSKASLHAKSVITDNHTVLGSYNLSNLARAGNFEVITVTATQLESVTTRCGKMTLCWQIKLSASTTNFSIPCPEDPSAKLDMML